MRRLATWLLVAALCGTVVSLGTLAALFGHCARSTRVPVHAIRALEPLAPGAAMAQTSMKFHPVPPESAARLERPARRGAIPAAPVPPATGSPEAANPEVPAAPEPEAVVPEVESNRSGDLVRFGSDVHVLAGQTVRGDVVAMGGDITVDGHVRGDVVAMGGDVSLGPSGQVDGQVVTLGGQLHEAPGSHVGGQRVSAGGLSRRWHAWPFLGAVSSGIKVAWDLSKMLIFLLIAWGLTQLAPARTRAAFDSVKQEPMMAFGIGLLAWALVIPSIVAMALVVAILCITIIGIPLAIAVVLGYVLACILLCVWGYVVGVAVLGERLGAQLGRPTPGLTMMAVWGIVALTAVRAIGHLFGALPMGGAAGGLLVVLSTVACGVLVTVGAGALLRTQLRRDALGRWWPGGPGPQTAAGTAPSYPAAGVAPPPATSPPPATPPPAAGFGGPHPPAEPPAAPAGPATP